MAKGEYSLYDELTRQDLFVNNSGDGLSKEAAKSLIDNFTPDMLDAMSEEIDDIFKVAKVENTVEDLVTGKAGTMEDEFSNNIADGKQAILENLSKKANDESEDETIDSEALFSELTKVAEEEGEEFAQMLLKEAYDLAEGVLSENGFDLTDYAFLNVKDEKVAEFVADKAEKLAAITDEPKNSYQIVNDIIASMASLTETGEE